MERFSRLRACGASNPHRTAAMPIFRVSVTARTAKAVSYQHRSGATKIDFRGTDLLPACPRRGEESRASRATSRSRWNSRAAAGDEVRRRISHLCAVGHHSGGPHGQPGRGPAQWNKEQAGRKYRAAGVRTDGYRRTLLRGYAAERPDCDGKCGARRYQGQDRGDRCQVRTVAARPICSAWRTRWR